MESSKGFTLIELMVVIFIVGILAAVAIPIMRGRIDSAKWSEGKAGAGSIRTAARAFCAEKGPGWGAANYAATTLANLGFTLVSASGGDDLDGKYFTNEAYEITFTDYNDYEIKVTAASSISADKPTTPTVVTIDEDGTWAETP